MNKSILFRVLSVIVFPTIVVILCIIGIFAYLNMKLISETNPSYTVHGQGTISLHTDVIDPRYLDVRVSELADDSVAGFKLDYYQFNTLTESVTVVIESNMPFKFIMGSRNPDNIGTIEHETSGVIYFQITSQLESDEFVPTFTVTTLKNQSSIAYWIFVYTIILAFCLLNVWHIIHIHKNYVFKSSPNIPILQKIGLVLLSLFVPVGGQIFYIIGVTNLYETKRIRRGTYAGLGYVFGWFSIATILLIIIVII